MHKRIETCASCIGLNLKYISLLKKPPKFIELTKLNFYFDVNKITSRVQIIWWKHCEDSLNLCEST